MDLNQQNFKKQRTDAVSTDTACTWKIIAISFLVALMPPPRSQALVSVDKIDDAMPQPAQQQSQTSTESSTPLSVRSVLGAQLQLSSTPTVQEEQIHVSYFACATGGRLLDIIISRANNNANDSCISSAPMAWKTNPSPYLQRNSSAVEATKPSLSSQSDQQKQKGAATSALLSYAVPKVEILTYKAPVCLSVGGERCFRTLPPATSSNKCDSNECPICMSECSSVDMGSSGVGVGVGVGAHALAVTLVKCGHVYHKECIQEAFKRSPRCPKCRADIMEPQGRSPSGR